MIYYKRSWQWNNARNVEFGKHGTDYKHLTYQTHQTRLIQHTSIILFKILQPHFEILYVQFQIHTIHVSFGHLHCNSSYGLNQNDEICRRL